MKPDKAVVMCICGERRTVKIGGDITPCSCGAQLRVEREREWDRPWAMVDNLKAMKKAGLVKYNKPEIVEYRYPR